MSLNHIVKNGLADVDLSVKSLIVDGQPITPNESLFYYEPVAMQAAVPYGAAPVVINNPSNAIGSNIWTPKVGDTLEYIYQSQLASTNPENTIDFNILYDNQTLAFSSFNLLNLIPTLSPASGLEYGGSILCSAKDEISPGVWAYTFISSLRVKASKNPLLLIYCNESSFSTASSSGSIDLTVSAPFTGDLLTANITLKSLN